MAGQCAAGNASRKAQLVLDPRAGAGLAVVRVAVPAEEVLQPPHIGLIGRADQDGTAGGRLHQRNDPQDQRTQHTLAEIGLRDDERPQLFGRHHRHFHVCLCVTIDQRCPTRQSISRVTVK